MGHVVVLLDGGAEGALDVVVFVGKDLLELVEHQDELAAPFLGDTRRRRQHLVEGLDLLGGGATELQRRVAALVEGERGVEAAEERLAGVEELVGARGSGGREGLGGRLDEGVGAVGGPEVHVDRDEAVGIEGGEDPLDERGLAHAPLGVDKETVAVLGGAREVGLLLMAVAEGVGSNDTAVLEGVDRLHWSRLRGLRYAPRVIYDVIGSGTTAGAGLRSRRLATGVDCAPLPRRWPSSTSLRSMPLTSSGSRGCGPKDRRQTMLQKLLSRRCWWRCAGTGRSGRSSV